MLTVELVAPWTWGELLVKSATMRSAAIVSFGTIGTGRRSLPSESR